MTLAYFNTNIKHTESEEVYFLMEEIYKTRKYGVEQDYTKNSIYFQKRLIMDMAVQPQELAYSTVSVSA
jgi:hypothetical protein